MRVTTPTPSPVWANPADGNGRNLLRSCRAVRRTAPGLDAPPTRGKNAAGKCLTHGRIFGLYRSGRPGQGARSGGASHASLVPVDRRRPRPDRVQEPGAAEDAGRPG